VPLAGEGKSHCRQAKFHRYLRSRSGLEYSAAQKLTARRRYRRPEGCQQLDIIQNPRGVFRIGVSRSSSASDVCLDVIECEAAKS